MTCTICGKESFCGNINDGMQFCGKCIDKYGPSHYGFMSGKELKKYILINKNKRWWQFWK